MKSWPRILWFCCAAPSYPKARTIHEHQIRPSVGPVSGKISFSFSPSAARPEKPSISGRRPHSKEQARRASGNVQLAKGRMADVFSRCMRVSTVRVAAPGLASFAFLNQTKLIKRESGQGHAVATQEPGAQPAFNLEQKLALAVDKLAAALIPERPVGRAVPPGPVLDPRIRRHAVDADARIAAARFWLDPKHKINRTNELEKRKY